VENVENLYGSTDFSVINQVLSSREPADTGRNVIAFSSNAWGLSEKQESISDGVDQLTSNIYAGALCPIVEDRIQVPARSI
jgi:hypothetical protein